jgi:prepilin-type processing-associated H-X9-DG protein
MLHRGVVEVLTSELIALQNGDIRGFSGLGYYGGVGFPDWFVPNTSSPDDLGAASYCGPAGNPRCVAQTATTGLVLSARSRHPGGVNAGMGDGSIRFIKNSISLPTSRPLPTTRAGEVVSSDFYYRLSGNQCSRRRSQRCSPTPKGWKKIAQGASPGTRRREPRIVS